MKKCDFCEKSLPNGECSWSLHAVRGPYCEKAIEKMVEAFKSITVDKEV